MSGSQLTGTFSIVASDPVNGDIGVAVASKVLACGAHVPYAEEGVGAVATQSITNHTYGPNGLKLLKRRFSPSEVVKRLVKRDPFRDLRQVGIVDARGRAVAFTGKKCFSFAGHHVGKGYAVSGNTLKSENVLSAMAKAYEKKKGELAGRLLAALEAGEKAGGDARGKQSAALLVVKQWPGFPEWKPFFYINLRVDDHVAPVQELARLYHLVQEMHRTLGKASKK